MVAARGREQMIEPVVLGYESGPLTLNVRRVALDLLKNLNPSPNEGCGEYQRQDEDAPVCRGRDDIQYRSR